MREYRPCARQGPGQRGPSGRRHRLGGNGGTVRPETAGRRHQRQANNTTRFAVFSRTQNRPERTGERDSAGFILLFTVQNKAGALAQTLNIIGAHGYNMKNLRSRPMKDLQWNYYFYIEAEGNINNDNGEMLLRELSALCARLKLVGIY